MAEVAFAVEHEVALLELSHPPVNALSHAVRLRIGDALQRAADDPRVAAVVLRGSGGTFIAGADIKELGTPLAASSPTLRELVALIEAFAKPVIAAIEGSALGGGLELALGCHWRVATAAARLGLPEVRLGLIPGAGGTQRLPRLVGPDAAISLMTSGRPIAAREALELGLIDELVGDTAAAALVFARRILAERRPLRVTIDLPDRLEDADPAVFTDWRGRLDRRSRLEPAPLKVVDCVEAACNRPVQEALTFERTCFEELLASPQHKALKYQFFAERRTRRIPDLPVGTPPLPVRRAAVIGAGTMGAGIAMCFANGGIPVTLVDQSTEALERGIDTIESNYARSVARGSLAERDAEQARGLIRGATDYAELGEVDLVVEAVFEDLTVKQEVFGKLDDRVPEQAVLASNTSTLDIDRLAAAARRPDKVIGMHFFSPAHVMRLLECVRGEHTSPQVIVTAMALGRRLGKVPVLAGNCDGFIGNRMWQFYTGEAEFLLEEGATPEQIDGVMERFGMPMGPLAVRDLAGNDIGLAIKRARAPTLPPDERRSPILERLVQLGRLGQKTGAGFYRYEGRTRITDPAVTDLIDQIAGELGIARRPIDDEEILCRLLHPLVNEGANILAEGIALRASDIDIVYVNGYGFPAARGGPMYWAQAEGLDKVVATMRRLQEDHGGRWKPAPLLERVVAAGEGWDTGGED